VLLQADVNDNDDDDHEPPKATSPPKEAEVPEVLIEGFEPTSEPESPQKLYPTAPELDESDESNASVHSTEV
jgi:hypothetical protein